MMRKVCMEGTIPGLARLALLSLSMAAIPACVLPKGLGSLSATEGEGVTTTTAATDDSASSTTTTTTTDSTASTMDGTATADSDWAESTLVITEGSVSASVSDSDTGTPACFVYTDKAHCEAAGCVYFTGAKIVADGDGCEYDGQMGFCALSVPEPNNVGLYHNLDGDVVGLAFEPGPGVLPAEWVPCDCQDPGAPLACACDPSYSAQDCAPTMTQHCGDLDEAACEAFQSDSSMYQCRWVSPVKVAADDLSCAGEAALPGCTATLKNTVDDYCEAGTPPASCDEAAIRPYYFPGEAPGEILLVDDFHCDEVPLLAADCWVDDAPAGCECSCLP